MVGSAALTTLMSRTTRTCATRAIAMIAQDWRGSLSCGCDGFGDRWCRPWRRGCAAAGAGGTAVDGADSVRLIGAPGRCRAVPDTVALESVVRPGQMARLVVEGRSGHTRDSCC